MNGIPCVIVLLLAIAGCAAAAPARPAASAGSGDRPGRPLAEGEDEVLDELAAIDRRFAARAGMTPKESDLRRVAMGAVLAGDVGVAVVDGAIDPFSFEARARGIAGVRQKVGVLA